MAIVGSDLAGEFRPKPGHLRTELPPQRVTPGLHLCRKLIEDAFLSACQCRNGRPTQDALDAHEWLSSSLNWTRRNDGKIPPPSLRAEYIGSFSWCCQWLGFDEDVVRETGLPRQSCRAEPFRQTVVPSHPQRTKPIKANGKHVIKHIAGLREVRERRRVAAEEWQQHSAVTNVNAALVTEPEPRDEVFVIVSDHQDAQQGVLAL
jgi:hypothetical protein